MSKFLKTLDFINLQFPKKKDAIFLHEPVFRGNEKKYLEEFLKDGKLVSKQEEIVVDWTDKDLSDELTEGYNK